MMDPTTVIAWLLDPEHSDPSIRWQVLRDLLDAPHSEWAAERAKVVLRALDYVDDGPGEPSRWGPSGRCECSDGGRLQSALESRCSRLCDTSSKGDSVSHPNEELVRRGYEAFATGDMATLNELFADDIVWHAPGRSELAGTFRGKDEVFANLQKNMELTGGTFRLDVHAIMADDEHAVGLLRARAEREGKTLDDNTVQVFHIQDGKVTESWLHPSDAYASDEFWA
jgi:ketosteroid isomerase-like protein